MTHQTIVLHELLTNLPWARFNELVSQHQADKHVRTLPTKTVFLALLHAQLAGLAGLRETVDVMQTQASQLRHLGIRQVPKSTFADALYRRPSAVF